MGVAGGAERSANSSVYFDATAENQRSRARVQNRNRFVVTLLATAFLRAKQAAAKAPGGRGKL